MSLSTIQTYAEEYFNSLNPIAERISVDVSNTRDAYEDLWHTLSYKDQTQVINETIIHPEAVLKYSFFPHNEPGVEYFPRLWLQTGQKYVTDDEGNKGSGQSWRDEHSAPFSWMTQSQLNLCNVENEETGRKRLNTISNFPLSGQQKPKPSPNKKTHAPHSSVSFVDPPSVVLGGSTSKLAEVISAKLKFPPKIGGNGDDNLLTKIKNKTAVLKIQTLKSTVSKTSGDISGSKASEREVLVHSKNTCSITASSKPSKSGAGKTVISKPKTPPPPPPCKQKPLSVPSTQVDSEKAALLQESPGDELGNVQLPRIQLPKKVNQGSKQSRGSLESLENFQVELKIPSGSNTVPKTGFDFLDNW